MNSVISIDQQPGRLTHSRHEKWGMGFDEYEAHVAEYGSSSKRGSPMHRYLAQRSGARQRGIEWQFDFKRWWAVWEGSGKWECRGQSGYVMGRHRDGETPYSPETVEIITALKNIRDGAENNRARRRATLRKDAGCGKGYSEVRTKTGVLYAARFRDKGLGKYPTAEQARAAYLAAYEAAKN